MGQKTHPIGVRLGINERSQSHWYAKKIDYAFFLKEDQYLRDYIFKTCRHCLVLAIEIERREMGIRIRISAAQVRPLVGVDGKALEKLRGDLQRKCRYLRNDYLRHFGFLQTNIKINEKPSIQIFVRQLSRPESDAIYLADFIVIELEKRTPFRRVMRIAQERAQKLGQVRGLRLHVSGRLNGAEIARTEWIRGGRVPLHTLSAELDYAYKAAHTIYGLLGVKVWIFRPIEKKVLPTT